jgi:RimJ/RimL family protein N-acetyltransferase
MSSMPTLETARLRLRPVVEGDLDALVRLNGDPELMRYIGNGKPLDRATTWRQIATIMGHQQFRGYSILALEDRASGELIGRSGPWFPEGWPMVEVGWVINPKRHGAGLATEAGRASLEWCFSNLPVDQVCSLIAPANTASARVAEKLGGKLESHLHELGQGGQVDVWIHRRPADLPRPSSDGAPCADSAENFEILSQRFRLRPFRERDLDELATLYADADVMRYIGDGKPLNRQQTWRAIASFLGHRQMRGYTTLAIEDRRTGVFVGEAGPWQPEGWPLLEVGWLVDPRRQGQGIATEVAHALLDWCFANQPVDEICSIIHPDNLPSARVAAKVGAKIERRIELYGQPQDLWIHRRP